MTKLHQILAIESGVRAQSQKDLTAAHHGLQKQETLMGIERSYQPSREDGEPLPQERQLLVTRVRDVVRDTAKILSRVFDVIATRDYANMKATADVVVNGAVLVKDAPTPYLLWLEKRLEDLHTFVTKLPTLPADIEWVYDANQNCYRNKHEIKTVRTAKIPYPLVLAPATPEHPAQVVKETRDEIVGHWTTIKYSGGIAAEAVKAMKDRVETLQAAVKYARERANEVEIADVKVGDGVMKYVFGDMI